MPNGMPKTDVDTDLPLRRLVARVLGWRFGPAAAHGNAWHPPGSEEPVRLPAFEVDAWPAVLEWLTGQGWRWYLQCQDGQMIQCVLNHDSRETDGGSANPIKASGPTPGLAICRAVAGLAQPNYNAPTNE